MLKYPYNFAISSLIHFGFFFLLFISSSVSSPEHELLEISFIQSEAQAEQESKNMDIIPKSDIDALGNQCEHTYGGIGIEQGSFNIIKVVYEGYAADRAGIKPGDIIYSKGEIRGTPGTTVLIKIFRNKQFLDFTIIREKICYNI